MFAIWVIVFLGIFSWDHRIGWVGNEYLALNTQSAVRKFRVVKAGLVAEWERDLGTPTSRLVLPTKPYFLIKLTSSRVKDRFLLSMQNTSWGNGVMIGLDGQVYLHFKNVRTLWDK